MKYLGYVLEALVATGACCWIHHASLERQAAMPAPYVQPEIQWEPRGGMPTQYQPQPEIIYSRPRNYNY